MIWLLWLRGWVSRPDRQLEPALVQRGFADFNRYAQQDNGQHREDQVTKLAEKFADRVSGRVDAPGIKCGCVFPDAPGNHE